MDVLCDFDEWLFGQGKTLSEGYFLVRSYYFYLVDCGYSSSLALACARKVARFYYKQGVPFLPPVVTRNRYDVAYNIWNVLEVNNSSSVIRDRVWIFLVMYLGMPPSVCSRLTLDNWDGDNLVFDKSKVLVLGSAKNLFNEWIGIRSTYCVNNGISELFVGIKEGSVGGLSLPSFYARFRNYSMLTGLGELNLRDLRGVGLEVGVHFLSWEFRSLPVLRPTM
jgi:integrase